MRKNLLSLFLFTCISSFSYAQYWQQQVNFIIDVTLNDKNHTLDGFEKIEYTNNSPDTLSYIWFHLWPNAYKNDKTAFTDQSLENGSTDFYFSDAEQKGYINRLDFKVNSVTATIEDHPQHIDIVKIVLPTPLAPGKTITITTPFHVKLPFNFSRGGHDGDSYQVTQWYPKPAVYDKDGWHPMPYLDQGEFYSEFGNYQVRITVPDNYVVASTGVLQDEGEKQWNNKRRDYDWKPIESKEKTRGGQIKKTVQLYPASSPGQKTLEFRQQNVHDFAWFADKRFIVMQDTLQFKSGRVIQLQAFYTPEQKGIWENAVLHAKDAVILYSNLVGEYPYDVVSVVQGPESFGGGMEYPTITVISPIQSRGELENVVVHEVGHNWFYGILASNERKYPWLDEGINSYYEARYHNRNKRIADELNDHFQSIALQTMISQKKDQPISTSSEEFSELNYGLIGYYKTSLWLAWLAKEIGVEQLDKAMQEYYRQWQFKHPQPGDLKKVLESYTGRDLDSAFAFLDKKGNLPGMERKGFALRGPIAALANINFQKNCVVTISPVFGFNSYDKLLLGGYVTNFKAPPSRFQFLAIPLYGFGSRSMNGTGLLKYTFIPDGFVRKIDIMGGFSTYTMDRFEDAEKNKTFLHFTKIVPGLRLTFGYHPRSTKFSYLQFKTFIINEDQLRFYRDTVITNPGPDTTIFNRTGTTDETTTINQLKFVFENNRALYPYNGDLTIEHGKEFVKAGFTGNYFFNYPKGGGLQARLFAGKFLYTSSRTQSKVFATQRYHLNLLAPSGYEDYTYSDYFIGRNEFEGIASQQVMEKEGAMKLRLEQFEGDPGFRRRVLSDDWIMSINLNTTLPNGLLPKFLPLRIFADIGTSAGSWDADNTYGKISFVAGLQLSLLKNTINIYAPLLYSSEYKNLLQSDPDNNKFLRKISFSIDISHFNLRKFDRNLDL